MKRARRQIEKTATKLNIKEMKANSLKVIGCGAAALAGAITGIYGICTIFGLFAPWYIGVFGIFCGGYTSWKFGKKANDYFEK